MADFLAIVVPSVLGYVVLVWLCDRFRDSLGDG